MEQEQNRLATWAVVELMGHQKEVGYVTTQYYGPACLFKIDVPDLPEREETVERPRWVGETMVPSGTVIRLPAEPGRSRMVGVPAVYAINPCDEETAMRVIRESVGMHDIKIVSLAGCKQLPLTVAEDDDEEEEDEEEGEEAQYPF